MDLISRQAAIDLFQRISYDDWNQGVSTTWANAYAEAADMVENLPPVDAVQVVRCKDCKYYQFADNRAFGFPVKRCEFTGFEDVDDDDFCSRGERNDG